MKEFRIWMTKLALQKKPSQEKFGIKPPHFHMHKTPHIKENLYQKY